jgi:NAD(P)-dependent dehydrogenase (short-subunit alcohol dehydrogenase family)
MSRVYQDKVAIVTGAAGGIGAALVSALQRAGAIVVAADLNASAHAVDVTNYDAVKALVDATVAEHGRLDFMFNNAGVGLVGEVRDLEIDDWRPVMDVNLWGVIHGVQAAYPLMVAQGWGHIVNTASGAGLCPRPGMVPYAASKYAVVGLSTSLREEAAELGVRVSAACPGYIGTGIIAATPFKRVDGDALMKSVPIKPMSPEDCARVILKGVAGNRAIIPVTVVTWVEWLLQRWAPWVIRLIARFRARKFRAFRELDS